jgi:acylphosphatase
VKEQSGEENVRVRIRVTGRVQGVGFRAGARRRAADLGLSGTAENLDDGSVRIEMRGARAAVDQLVAWCRQGPPAAEVDAVDVTEFS